MAKPKLALIPATIGTKLFSVLPSNGSGDFDFTRASAATRINEDGFIETVASGDSRLDYPLIDGVVNGCPSVLLEPQRTNLVTYSEDFSNAYWTKTGASVVSDAAISPDGSLNADKLVEDTTTGNHNISRTGGFFPIGTHTLSFYAKKGENNYILFGNSSANDLASFDLNTGSIFSTDVDLDNSSIESFPNGWYRCSITITRITAANFGLYMSKDGSTRSYAGDGTSGVYIYGAQLEEGSYPTSYIPTNGTAVTRLAETANGAGDASTFNDSEGVFMVEISALANDGKNRDISITDGTSSNVVTIRYTSTDNETRYKVKSGGTATVNDTIIISSATDFNKIAFKYKENDFALWINGVEVATDIIGATPIGLSELVFDDGDGANDFYGKTKQIQYFQIVLTDSELEELTSWDSFTAMAYGQLYTIK
ncbi:hypothetical protein N9Q05_01860 [bacterium]|nr:hypothetical protein [bacterium]